MSRLQKVSGQDFLHQSVLHPLHQMTHLNAGMEQLLESMYSTFVSHFLLFSK